MNVKMERVRYGFWVGASLAALSLAGCRDIIGVQTQPQSPAQGGGASSSSESARRERPRDPYIEGETCIRSDDCPRDTRCIDGRCTLTQRSLQAEVLTERGARALALQQFNEAVQAYRGATEAYRGRALPVPSHVQCGLARALNAQLDRASGSNDGREEAARALQGCLAASPQGTAQADQAVGALTSLSERGLDPANLDRDGGQLVTGRDPRPTFENTRVRITFTGAGTGSRATFRDMVVSDVIQREIARCFLNWWQSSHQNEDQGTIRVTYARSTDDYDTLTAPRLTATPADIVAQGGDAGANVHWLQCGAQAIQTGASTLRWPGAAERWAETVVVSVGPR